MAYSFLQQSIRDGSLRGWWDFRRWRQPPIDLRDLSGQGNDITISSGAVRAGGGYCLAPNAGYLSAPDDISLTVNPFTLLVVGNFLALERPAAAPGTLLARIGGGVIEWSFGIDDTPRLIFVDTAAANTRTRAVDYRGMRTLGVTAADGGTPVGYGDGVSVGSFSGVIDLNVGPGSTLWFGNRDTTDRSLYNPLHAALIWGRVLTAAEMATAHAELMALPGGES